MSKVRKSINPNRAFFVYVICLFVICHSSIAYAKAYDGIWFLGFNFKHELFKDVRVRQAIAHTINRKFIATRIMSEEVIPISIIPPGMLGYEPDLKPYKNNPKFAKLLMKRAGYPIKDKRLKKLTLLHTDGLKTIAIVKRIKKDLEKIGMKIKLVQVSYTEHDKWVKELKSGKHDFFVMGYKAGIEQLFVEADTISLVDSYSLVQPLFATNGEANFSHFRSLALDEELAKISGLDLALKSERHARLKKVNRLLYKALPVIACFYIEKF